MNKIFVTAETQAKNVFEEIAATESLQELSKNLSVENLILLAEKSKKKDINKKIQKYKYLI